MTIQDFLGGSDDKASVYNAGDLGLIPGLGRFSGEGNGNPFQYDLNEIPYSYTVEVTNRFKGLDLIEYLKNYEQRLVTLYRRQ